MLDNGRLSSGLREASSAGARVGPENLTRMAALHARKEKHMLRAIGCIVLIVVLIGLLMIFGLLDAIF